VAVNELISTTISGVVAVNVIGFLMMPHWTAVGFIFPIIIILYFYLLGESSYVAWNAGRLLKRRSSLILCAVVFLRSWDSLLLTLSIGTLQLCGVFINAVTYVTVVIAIGLLVDYVMHILMR
jgi:tryptophan-rich sensory protein